MVYLLEIYYVFEESGFKDRICHLKKFFNSKEEACEYYNKENPHMEPLNPETKLESDPDPKTNMMYAVKERFFS